VGAFDVGGTHIRGTLVETDGWQPVPPLVPPEGRIDLTTVDGAPLEDTVSRRALLKVWRSGASEMKRKADGDVRDLASHARAGAALEAGVLRHAFHALGRAAAPWVTAFRPTVLVVGGGMSAAWDLIEAPLSAGLMAGLTAAGVHSRPVLVQARYANDAPLLGAAWHASLRRTPPPIEDLR
jgi:glucokinase